MKHLDEVRALVRAEPVRLSDAEIARARSIFGEVR